MATSIKIIDNNYAFEQGYKCLNIIENDIKMHLSTDVV